MTLEQLENNLIRYYGIVPVTLANQQLRQVEFHFMSPTRRTLIVLTYLYDEHGNVISQASVDNIHDIPSFDY